MTESTATDITGAPLVSVCIPTYKGGAYLAAAIDSVLAQSYRHLELIVVDDNSPDDTAAIVAAYDDPRIQYFKNPANLGPQGNWNRCLDLAVGKYFKLLPHDDLLAQNCLETQVKLLEEDTEHNIALVFGSREIIDPSGRVLMKRGCGSLAAGRVSASALARRCVRAGTNLIGEPGNGLFRRSLVEKIGPYDATFPYVVDLDYWFRVMLHGDAYYTNTTTSSFRISSGQWSVAIGNKQHADFKGFTDRFSTYPRFAISTLDKLIGQCKAPMNTVARALFYRYLFAGK